MKDNRKVRKAKKSNDFTKCSHYKWKQTHRFLKWTQKSFYESRNGTINFS
jgi:hypothetical protein